MSCGRHSKWICWEILRVGRRYYMVSAEWLQTDSSGNSNTPLHPDHEMGKWVLYPPVGIYGDQIWQSPSALCSPEKFPAGSSYETHWTGHVGFRARVRVCGRELASRRLRFSSRTWHLLSSIFQRSLSFSILSIIFALHSFWTWGWFPESPESPPHLSALLHAGLQWHWEPFADYPSTRNS